jgi:two-component system nitrogen regulation response regulator GlnG
MLQKLEKTRKSRVRRVSPEAMAVLMRHRWPGNVRELENAIYRSAVVAQGDMVLLKDLPPELRELADSVAAPATAENEPASPAVVPESKPAPGVAPQETPVAPAATVTLSRDELFDRLFGTLVAENGADLLKHIETAMVRRALAHTGDNQARAAELLGITRNTLKKRMDELGL